MPRAYRHNSLGLSSGQRSLDASTVSLYPRKSSRAYHHTTCVMTVVNIVQTGLVILEYPLLATRIGNPLISVRSHCSKYHASSEYHAPTRWRRVGRNNYGYQQDNSCQTITFPLARIGGVKRQYPSASRCLSPKRGFLQIAEPPPISGRTCLLCPPADIGVSRHIVMCF